MKKSALFILFAIQFLTIYSQDITGYWVGLLNVGTQNIHLNFNITKTDGKLSGTMDSPDQGAFGIPIEEISFEKKQLKVSLLNHGITYLGALSKDELIEGKFTQKGQTIPLILSKSTVEKAGPKRPQEPKEPFSYYSEDIKFENPAGKNVLAGTLTLPSKEGKFPVVVLISGSGPQNRNGELLGHKPFWVMADFLAKNGIGVLRFDDRGTGQSTGDFKSATSQDFATDVEAAVTYLKTRTEIIPTKIGLIGHSEGGIIAPMVASKSQDVAFVCLMAAPAIPGDQLLVMQSAALLKASGMPEDQIQKIEKENNQIYNLVKTITDIEELKKEIRKSLNEFYATEKQTSDLKAKIEADVAEITSPWMRFFINYDPSIALEKMNCSVFAVNGEKDLQVPAKENLEAIKKARQKAGNKPFVSKELPKLNHLFQTCTTGLPDEYIQIEETYSTSFLMELLKWLNVQVK